MTDNEVKKLQEERSKAIINIWLTRILLEICKDSPEITPEQIKAYKENIEKWSKRAAVKVDKGGKGSIKTIAFLSYDDKNITINGLTDSERILEKRADLDYLRLMQKNK